MICIGNFPDPFQGLDFQSFAVKLTIKADLQNGGSAMKAYRLDERKDGAAKRTGALEARGVTINDALMAKYPNLEKFVDQLIGYSFGKKFKL